MTFRELPTNPKPWFGHCEPGVGKGGVDPRYRLNDIIRPQGPWQAACIACSRTDFPQHAGPKSTVALDCFGINGEAMMSHETWWFLGEPSGTHISRIELNFWTPFEKKYQFMINIDSTLILQAIEIIKSEFYTKKIIKKKNCTWTTIPESLVWVMGLYQLY